MPVLGTTTDSPLSAPTLGMSGPVDRTGFFSNIGAGFSEAQAGPASTRSRQNAYEARYYDQIIAALTSQGELGTHYTRTPLLATSPFYRPQPGDKVIGGIVYNAKHEPFRNPYTAHPDVAQDDDPLARLYLNGDTIEKQAIWGAVQDVRKRNPDFLKNIPDEAALETLAAHDRMVKLGQAQAVTSKASTLGKVGEFIGNMAGSIAAGDPEAVGGLFAGGSVWSAPAKSVARQVLRSGVEGAATNVVYGATAIPGQLGDSERLGVKMTGEDVLHNEEVQAGIGAVFGGAHAVLPHLPEAVQSGTDAAIGAAPKPVRDAVIAASVRAGTVQDRGLLTEWQRTTRPYAAVGDVSTPDEKAAHNVLNRDVENREMSPLSPEADASHLDRLKAIADTLGVQLKDDPELPTAAPMVTPSVPDRSQSATAPKRPASYVEAVNRAEGFAKNPRSSAYGYGQFTRDTWLEYAPRVTDTAGMSRTQILALRKDKGIADRATQLYAQDNARYLRSRGIEDSPGNLSLAHFLGPADAAKVLSADPATPVESLLSPKVINANHEVLENRSASEVIAWAHKRIGASVEAPPARPDAVDDEDFDYTSPVPYTTAEFKPDEVQTDARLMQYKSGGDENGVTDTLKGVEAWNPLLSQQLLVWEGLDGRRVVVDGHQRVGLAKRLYPADQSITLPSVVIREADGISAKEARVIGALRNIANGSGTIEDNARVLRDAPQAASTLPRNAPLARDSLALSRLSYDAFGAVMNDVIDPEVAAQIGLHAQDRPEAHMPLVHLLAKEKVSNRAEAGMIVRQALADGFGEPEETQLSMLGDTPMQSLYAPVARIMTAAAKRLRREKRTFSVLADEAGKIEAAGNILDRAANQGKVLSSDEALAILEATAHRSGPVRDALIHAARAELSGARRANAVNQFLDALSTIDLRAAAGAVGPDGGVREPSGGAGRDLPLEAADQDVPDRSQPSLLDQALTSRDQSERFSDPVGQAAKEQTALLDHDLRMDAQAEAIRAGVPYIDPRMLAKINGGHALPPDAAGAPLESETGRAGVVPPETRESAARVAEAPPSLFGTDIGYRLTEGEENPRGRPIHEIMTEAEADELAAQAAKVCLK